MDSRIVALGCAAVLALAACADEDPVGLPGLMPGEPVETVELVLDADEFLAIDTAVTGFTPPGGAPYMIVAEDFGGAVDAHGLVRLAPLPGSVSFVDSAGATQSDTLPEFTEVAVVVRVDSTRVLAPGPAMLALYRIAEPWDAASATWTLRVDTGAVQEPWAEPGGSRAALVGRIRFQPGDSTVRFPVDSQTIALLADTAVAERGVLIVSETPGVRLRFDSPRLHFSARPSARPDTVVTDSVAGRASTFVFDPPAPPQGELFVGGRPAWRSFLQLHERLDSLPIPTTLLPCPPQASRCPLRLSDVTVNAATLLLQPVEPPAGFVPAGTIGVLVRQALATDRIPFDRAPLGGSLAPLDEPVALVAADNFVAGADERVEIAIPGLLPLLSIASEVDEGEPDPGPPTIALVATPEGGAFGFGAFASRTAGAAAPKLRLVISVSNEVRFP